MDPLTRYEVDPITGCWLWLGPTYSNGYGRLQVGQQYHLAHRFFYEHHVRLLLPGEVLDHVCRVKVCVNPSIKHLEPVTQLENIRRGLGTKLSYDQLVEIDAWFNTEPDVPHWRIARKYGVSRSRISQILGKLRATNGERY